MKWYSKDKTRYLNLDCIGYWAYYKDVGMLKVFIDSSTPLTFYGNEAIEIYNMLLSEKEVI